MNELALRALWLSFWEHSVPSEFKATYKSYLLWPRKPWAVLLPSVLATDRIAVRLSGGPVLMIDSCRPLRQPSWKFGSKKAIAHAITLAGKISREFWPLTSRSQCQPKEDTTETTGNLFVLFCFPIHHVGKWTHTWCVFPHLCSNAQICFLMKPCLVTR